MSPYNDRHIDERIASAMEDETPADVDRRLRSQLEDFRVKLGAAAHTTRRRSGTAGRNVSWRVATTMAAGIALIAMTGWVFWPRVSFADVAAAVLEQPWIHTTQTEPGGKTLEAWYSPTEDISATRYNDWVDYRDHGLGVYYSYDVAEKVLYRVPEYTPRRTDRYAAITTTLRVLLQDEQLVDNPLDRMAFLGEERKDMRLVGQELEKVEEDGQRWLDYHLTVRYRDLADPIEVLLRVDPETKLVRLSRFEGRWEGKHMASETRFDYPRKGPVNVYALGVPKTAKLVDRIPSDEVTKIIEAHRAGRQGMEDYRAVMVRQSGREWKWWTDVPERIIYHKGDKYRVDFPFSGRPRDVKKPPEDVDRGVWWREQVRDIRFYPMAIAHGRTRYTVKNRFVTDPDGSRHVEVESVKEYEFNVKPSDMYPPYYASTPEFACRPPMGIPSQELEAVVDLEPANGPEGLILLSVHRTGRMPRAPDPDADKHPPQPHGHHYWLDPARDYAVIRWDNLYRDESGKEDDSRGRVIEEMAQSPGGNWYATQIRRKNSRRVVSTGETYDDVTYLYVDFDVDLPDSMFEPPKPGRVF